MGNLIKNELIKIFKKKGTYIVLIIFFLYVILANCLYKYMGNFTSYDYRIDDEYIETRKSEINNIDINSDRQHYIDCKTDIDFYDLYKKYDKDSWQAYIIKRDFYTYLYNINVYKYGTEEDKQGLEENPEEVYNSEIEKLSNDNWKAYVQDEISSLKSQIESINIMNNYTDSSLKNEDMEAQISSLKLNLELAQMRLDKDIPYGDDFLNNAIEVRRNSAFLDTNLDKPNMSYQDKLSKQKSIENNELAKYVLETKQDVNNQQNLRGILMNSFDEYSIFILIFIVMIAGAIVSSEFEKGTIKMLLVKPFERGKILLSKYIVSLMMIVFIFAITIVFQLIVGGVMFGFDSLSIPAVVYNFDTNSIQTINLFKYLLIIAVNKLPLYILLATLAFAISSLFGNTVIAVVLPILGNMAGAIINQLASYYSIKQLAIFPTLNWDFTEFLFGKLPSYEFTSLPFAACVCVVYWIIMVGVAWIAFKKREIKNI